MRRVSDERLAYLLSNEANIHPNSMDGFYKAALDLREERALSDKLAVALRGQVEHPCAMMDDRSRKALAAYDAERER